jgi:hypothetical protein
LPGYNHINHNIIQWRVILFTLAVAWLTACQPQPQQVFIEVDGGRQALTTEVETVRQALEQAKVIVGALDRVEPDLYTRLEPGLTIVVTRVSEETDTTRLVVPFERQTITNEALAAGETRLAQLGVNGENEITVRIVYENGVEVSRTEISQRTVIAPVPEILVVGAQDELPPSPVDGTIAYLSNGNAWLMRDNSAGRRALTTEGNLDGRVFGLAPDGRNLLYTTSLPEIMELPLNELWLASTTIVGEKPITLGVQGALDLTWSPVVTQSVAAYTTAERVPNPPGWKANNDLWLLPIPSQNLQGAQPLTGSIKPAEVKPVQILPPSTPGLYPWWGTSFQWSPDGNRLAYARADQIGLVDLVITDTISVSVTVLADFTPLKTFSEWVWVPGISWSPDGKFIAAVIHGPPLASEPPEESQVFDLWLFSVDGKLSAKIAEQVGMWANPAWGSAGIVFGQALSPLKSVNSRYTIQLIDRDGSNMRRLYPFQSEPGVQLPELVWSPDGQEFLFIYNGDLHITHQRGGPARQLTSNTQASHPRWAASLPIVVPAASLTSTVPLTATPVNTITVTPSPPVLATPTLTATTILSGVASLSQ